MPCFSTFCINICVKIFEKQKKPTTFEDSANYWFRLVFAIFEKERFYFTNKALS
jgi:hypothetical protein